MKDLDDLNAEVTNAIMRAERATVAAQRAWQDVARLESELGRDERVTPAEQAIAQRGALMAKIRTDVLAALNGDRS